MELLPVKCGQLDIHLEKDQLQTHFGLFFFQANIGFSVFGGGVGALLQARVHIACTCALKRNASLGTLSVLANVLIDLVSRLQEVDSIENKLN